MATGQHPLRKVWALWFIHPVICYAIAAAALGPRDAANGWMFTGVYLSVLTASLLVPLALADHYTVKFRPVLNVLRPVWLTVARVNFMPGLVGQLYCWLAGFPIGDTPSPFAFETVAVRLGAFGSAGQFVIYFAEVIRALGFPPRGYMKNRKVYERINLVALFVMAFWASGAALFQPRYFWLWAWIGASIPLAGVSYWMFLLARGTFDAAVVAQRLPYTEPLVHPWAIHWTDVHLTEPGQKCAEGGAGGNAALDANVVTVLDLKPRFVFITGDLVDKGLESEWNEAGRLLGPLRERGCRVLLAPGNHDLLSPYSDDAVKTIEVTALVPTLAGHYNGQRLDRYLRFASALESQLELHDGRRLAQILEEDAQRFESVLEMLKRARELRSDPLRNDEVLSGIEREARDLIPGLSPVGGWAAVVDRFDWERSLQELKSAWYAGIWHDYFPLKTRDDETGSSLFILNSVPNDPFLLGSAWGFFGDAQVRRLRELFDKDGSSRLIVLMHHAAYRWEDEPAPRFALDDIQRWACLATASEDVQEFACLLSDQVSAGKEVVIFCGHRHGGAEREGHFGGWLGGKIVEGASLADNSSAMLGVSWGSGGRILVGRP